MSWRDGLLAPRVVRRDDGAWVFRTSRWHSPTVFLLVLEAFFIVAATSVAVSGPRISLVVILPLVAGLGALLHFNIARAWTLRPTHLEYHSPFGRARDRCWPWEQVSSMRTSTSHSGVMPRTSWIVTANRDARSRLSIPADEFGPAAQKRFVELAHANLASVGKGRLASNLKCRVPSTQRWTSVVA